MYNIGQISKLLGVTVKTVQNWDNNGKLKASRTKTNRRIYTKEQIDMFLGKELESRLNYSYVRVSSQSQRKDLKNQRRVLEDFVLKLGIANTEFIEEIGGGLNFKRKKFLELTSDISKGKVANLVIAHKDRLCRFGFDYFENLCKENDCKLHILNSEQLSPQEEMVNDLMSIIHCFSCRLYGLRNYKKDLKKHLKEDTNVKK